MDKAASRIRLRFVTKITKNDDKIYDTERTKVCKNGLKVGKSRKNHKNTPYTLSICAQSTHTHKHKKATPVRIEWLI